MHFSNSFEKVIPKITDKNFKSCALNLFAYQAKHNSIYSAFLKCLQVDPSSVKELEEIPFLPIEFFKQHEIKTGDWKEEKVFFSSGTTGTERGCHFVRDIAYYNSLALLGFEQFYGRIKDYIIIALLPSYQEQGNSSLIAMVDHFIQCSGNTASGYATVNDVGLKLKGAFQGKKKALLIGVSYALLDADYSGNSPDDFIVMETGGMKGRKREMIRSDLHEVLKEKYRVSNIHSEYGMTELLSQAYAFGQGKFSCPPWMKVIMRDINDPFEFLEPSKTGGINVIDLANVNTCAFIETKDLGRSFNDGTFEVLGRFDNSEIRGCNLLMV